MGKNKRSATIPGGPWREDTIEKVIIYSDGGSDPNPGIGGWAAILKMGRHEKIISGNDPETTNNRMELQAAISALSALKRPVQVEFHTDSEYLRKGITEYIEGWAEKGWKRQDKKPVANVDLWKELWPLVQTHEIEWHWVKGHSGNSMNERVDNLATQARLAITPDVSLSPDMPRLFIRASCKGNPGPGGWGVVLEEGGDTSQSSGWEPDTTNNRMELTAAVEALKMVPPGSEVLVFTLSDYLFQGATKWIHGWRQRDWKKKNDQPISNVDLWRQLDKLMTRYPIHWVNAKGDSYKEEQGLKEAADLAVRAAESLL
jgi:ribonuclease HI